MIVDVTNICQGEDRFTAIAFAAHDSCNRASRRDGGLRGVADAMFFQFRLNHIPLGLRVGSSYADNKSVTEAEST